MDNNPEDNKFNKPELIRPTVSVSPIQAATPVIKRPLKAEPTPITSSDNDGHRSGLRELFSTIGILATALVVALLMIGFVFRSYQVDGPSMQTTLQNGDKLIIWKVPRTWARITGHPYIPQRADVIVFSESGLGQFGQADTKQLIKRVIGLPGDRVVVKDNVITIYNPAHPSGFQPDKTLPYGNVIPATTGDVDLTLGSDQIFVSGDNRPNSLDSRAFGPIHASQIIGKLVIRLFPIGQAKAF